VQKQILDLLVHLQDEGMALVMITHDLGVARYLAQDGVVLREGEVRERGPMRQLLTDPEDSYTRMLLESAMDIRPPEPGDPGAQGTPARESATPAERLEDPLVRARGLVKEFPGAAGPIRAVDDVSFELSRGGTLGIVGERSEEHTSELQSRFDLVCRL